MTIDPHLSKPQHGLALLVHFVLLAFLAWRLTRHSADLSYGLLGTLCCIGQMILIFAFAADHLGYLVLASVIYCWVSWRFIGYIAEVDRSDLLKLAVSNPIFALIGVYSIFVATR
ncbi:hypothetical protein HAHE_24440 [Haloferula helveola]|uniref:Uncharacterized protein n=1 Tax=Haloferula helveola TaxID=490095 RepID=A0ABN6H4G4_9BACT|nr:hypothetical protein HAHE_24440 [Haloferula helveola]